MRRVLHSCISAERGWRFPKAHIAGLQFSEFNSVMMIMDLISFYKQLGGGLRRQGHEDLDKPTVSTLQIALAIESNLVLAEHESIILSRL